MAAGPDSQRPTTGTGVAPLEVVIAGGGVAALEATMALHALAQGLVRITMLAPGADFVYRPLAVLEPFAHRPPRHLPLADVAGELGAAFVQDRLLSVDGGRRTVTTAGGRELSYDALLIAVGARAGELSDRLMAIDVARMGQSMRTLIEGIDDGSLASLAFVVPRPAWSLPAYEMALLCRAHAWHRDRDVRIAILTAEPRPLHLFGEEVGDAVLDLLAESEIEVIAGAEVEVEPGAGELVVSPGARRMRFDRAVGMPRLQGPAIAGVPSDSEGFLPIAEHCALRGLPRVYAVGDCTSFPVKFGGIAARHADAAAEAIAAHAGAEVQPSACEGAIHGMLLGGRERRPLHFSAEFRDGVAHSSTVGAEPSASAAGAAPAAKIDARYLAPYLDELWAEGPRWVAGELAWETALEQLRQRAGSEGGT